MKISRFVSFSIYFASEIVVHKVQMIRRNKFYVLFVKLEFKLPLLLLHDWTVGSRAGIWLAVALNARNFPLFELRCRSRWCWRRCYFIHRLCQLPTVFNQNSRNCDLLGVAPGLSEVRLTLFPSNIAKRGFTQIFHHSGPQRVCNFVHKPWR